MCQNMPLLCQPFWPILWPKTAKNGACHHDGEEVASLSATATSATLVVIMMVREEVAWSLRSEEQSLLCSCVLRCIVLVEENSIGFWLFWGFKRPCTRVGYPCLKGEIGLTNYIFWGQVHI